MDVHALVLEELPPPPARVLEVGCGNGTLARALAADGYDVLAIDPDAPSGAIFRRTTIEAFESDERFDGAVISLALHHVADLDIALDRLKSVLSPGAPLVVREFGWDLVDDATARWDSERLGRAGGLAEWRAEHEHLYGFEAMRAALDARFRRRSFERGPYLSEFRSAEGHEREERRLIEAGEICAVGFAYVGLA